MLTNIIMAVLLFNLGFFARWIFFKNKPIGTIRVDQSQEEPYLFLELHDKDSINTIMDSKTVIFEVNVKDYAQK